MARRSEYMARKLDVLRAIAALTTRLRKSPTMREISDDTGISVTTLHSYLHRLSDEGLVEWRPKRHRSVRLTPSGQKLVQTDVPF